MKQFLLTTVDNPYHPVDELEKWLAYDLEHGYDTNRRLNRVVPIEYAWTDLEQQRAINAAVDDFVRLMPELYRKIVVDE